MKNCTLVDSVGNKSAVFTVDNDMVWVDIYDDETHEVWKTMGLTHELAEDLKKTFVETTDSKELPYNGVKVTYKVKE